MNTIKTAVVVIVLLGVAYGVYVMLNKPPQGSFLAGDGQGQPWTPPNIEMGTPMDGTPLQGSPAVAAPGMGPGGAAGGSTMGGMTPISPEQMANQMADRLSPGGLANRGGPPPFRPNNSPASRSPASNSQGQVDVGPHVPALAASAPMGPPPPASLTGSPAASGGPPTWDGSATSADDATPQADVPGVDHIPAVHAGSGGRDASAANSAISRDLLRSKFGGGAAEGYADASGHPSAAADSGYSPAPVDSGFDSAWESAMKQLQDNQLGEALFTLSLWYGNSQLTEEENGRLIGLLDQLAGTVIYSAQPHVEPLHEVRRGETLESIAREYNVPVLLLAAINGIEPPDARIDGERIKVVRGPFNAIVNTQVGEITLMVRGRYAGRFAATMGNVAPPPGTYKVREKIVERAWYTAEGREIPSGDPDNPIGPYWIGFDQGAGIHAAVDSNPRGGSIAVSPRDARDLFTILSVGSQVVVK